MAKAFFQYFAFFKDPGNEFKDSPLINMPKAEMHLNETIILIISAKYYITKDLSYWLHDPKFSWVFLELLYKHVVFTLRHIKRNNSQRVQALAHSFPMQPFSTPRKHQKTLEKGCTGNEWVKI